jgi:hypothetical protein
VGISAKEAAELVGMSKGGIIKAIRTGKISAAKDIRGEWSIEPVELFRVYPPVNGTQGVPDIPVSPEDTESARQDTPEITPSMQREVELLREMIQRQDEVISNLWERLEAEAEERRKLTLILTDSRSATLSPEGSQQPPAPVQNPKPWWVRLLGR